MTGNAPQCLPHRANSYRTYPAEKEKGIPKKKVSDLVWFQGRPGLSALAKQTIIRIDLPDEKSLQSNEKRKGNLQKKNKTGNQECPEQAYCRAVEKDDKTCSRNGHIKIGIPVIHIKRLCRVSTQEISQNKKGKAINAQSYP